MTSIAPDGIVLPQLAAAYRAAIKTCDFAIWLVGATGVFKSEQAALVQQHYGQRMTARNLPANFSATGNSLEVIAFHAKDSILVIDDFAPPESIQEKARYNAVAERLVRGAGNNQGRTRLKADATLRGEKYPRGLVFATGEDLPRGQSIRGRTFIIEVSRGDIRLNALSLCQQAAADGLYATDMGGFVQSLAQDYEGHLKHVQARVLEMRGKAPKGHARTPGIFADLYVGLEMFTDFVVAVGAISESQATELCDRAWRALNEVALTQRAPQ
jgi:hypothetical protein